MTASRKIRQCWERPPDWIVALACACDRTSQSAVARMLGMNSGYVSYALRNQRPQYHRPVEDAVRGKLMGETVECPVLGEVDQALCARHRKSRIRPIGPEQKRLRATCPGCIHNTNRKEETDA